MDKIEYDVFIKGKLIDLVCLNEEIAEKSNWYKWFNNEESTKHMQKHYFPNSRASQIDFLNELKKDKTKLQLGIVKKDTGLMVGIISMKHIDFINKNAEMSILIGESIGRKALYTEEACRLMFNHGFFTLNLHKIYVGYVKSVESLGIFLKRIFGFRDEGIWREHVFKNGEYVDVQRLGLLRSDYKRK